MWGYPFLWVYYICMDINAYPNINNLKIVSRFKVGDNYFSIGTLEVANKHYRAIYNEARDVLKLTSSSSKWLSTPHKTAADRKYILLLDKSSNLEIILNKDNSLYTYKLLKGTEYGLHFTK